MAIPLVPIRRIGEKKRGEGEETLPRICFHVHSPNRRPPIALSPLHPPSDSAKRSLGSTPLGPAPAPCLEDEEVFFVAVFATKIKERGAGFLYPLELLRLLSCTS